MALTAFRNAQNCDPCLCSANPKGTLKCGEGGVEGRVGRGAEGDRGLLSATPGVTQHDGFYANKF